MDPDVQEPQHNVSYEGMIQDQTSETRSVSLGSGKHIEEPVISFVERLASYTHTLFTNPLSQPLTDPLPTRYFYAYSS